MTALPKRLDSGELARGFGGEGKLPIPQVNLGTALEGTQQNAVQADPLCVDPLGVLARKEWATRDVVGNCRWPIRFPGIARPKRGLRVMNRVAGNLQIHPRVRRKPKLVTSGAARQDSGAVESRAAEKRSQLADDRTQRGLEGSRSLARPDRLRELAPAHRATARAREIRERNTALLSRERARIEQPIVRFECYAPGEMNTNRVQLQGASKLPPMLSQTSELYCALPRLGNTNNHYMYRRTSMADKKVSCDCGKVIREPTDDALVQAVQKHAQDVHNMKLSREQVLSMAEPQ